MAPKKIMVNTFIIDIIDELEGDLEKVISNLEALGHDYYGVFTKLWIEKGYASFDESSSYQLWGERKETDKEYEKRIKKLEKEKITRKAEKEKAKEEQYATYLYLKEKFEGGENA